LQESLLQKLLAVESHFFAGQRTNLSGLIRQACLLQVIRRFQQVLQSLLSLDLGYNYRSDDRQSQREGNRNS
jgi:hypothetical protein